MENIVILKLLQSLHPHDPSDKRPKLERARSAAEKENHPLQRTGSGLRRQYSHDSSVDMLNPAQRRMQQQIQASNTPQHFQQSSLYGTNHQPTHQQASDIYSAQDDPKYYQVCERGAHSMHIARDFMKWVGKSRTNREEK